jgi:hypothetical protein
MVGLLVGPWLDLQHWQRAIQIHRENTSIRGSYFIGGLIFFLLLLFHGCLAAWVLSKGGVETYGGKGLDGFRYAHELIVQFMDRLDDGSKGMLPAAYFGFLGICVLTTLDSGYVALKWFLGANVAKSQNLLVGMLPKRLLESPIPSFLLVAIITLGGLWARLELEYFMVFFASFFVGYASLAIARCFVPNSQQPLPQIRMFSLASISLVIFAFGYCTAANALLLLGSLLPLVYVIWLVVNTDLLRVVSKVRAEVIEAAAEIPAIKAIAKTAHAATGSQVVAPIPAGRPLARRPLRGQVVRLFDDRHLSGHQLGRKRLFRHVWLVCRENPRVVLQPGHAGLRSENHEVLHPHALLRAQVRARGARVRCDHHQDPVADFNRKFCTLEHQIFGSENELLGKGKQSLLFVSSKDYSLLDIPSDVYSAFMPHI